MREFVYLGGYTGESGGEAEGIGLLRRDPATGALTRLGVAARTPSPSFLAQHPIRPVLYAVNELDAGTVSAFAVAADGSLRELAVQETGGRHPCHLAVTVDGRYLLVANFTSGDVSVHPLDQDGAPAVRTDLRLLPGPQSHPHHVAPDRTGPDVLITDPGADRVWRARLDPNTGRLGEPVRAVALPPGTGPRHLVIGADGTLLIAGERSGTIAWRERDGTIGLVAASTSLGPTRPSALTTGADERFVYVANRGPDTISAFAWIGGKATLIAEVPSGGSGPRHVALALNHLYVANTRSHTVAVFRVDPDTGIPYGREPWISEPSPACVLRWMPAMAAGPDGPRSRDYPEFPI